jgi:copper homeostasis protein (lipoprotein)
MIRLSRLLFVLLLLQLVACGHKGRQVDTATPPFALPATFTGDILRTDQERMEILLNLRPDSLYQLRTTLYASDGKMLATTARMERWLYEPSGRGLLLGGSQGSSLEYVLVGEARLRFAGGRDAAGAMASHELGRQEYVAPFADTVRLRGMYRETGRRGELQECLGGGVFPVSDAGHGDQISAAYRKAARDPGEPLLVALQGRLVERERGGGEEIVVVEIERFLPLEECGGQTRTRVIGAQWQLRQMAGEAVMGKGSDRPPFLVLEPEGQRMQAFSGCNRIGGAFRLEGNTLVFKRTVSTRMACPGGNELENRFLAMLDATATYRVDGASLTLFDQAGRPLANFIAVE